MIILRWAYALQRVIFFFTRPVTIGIRLMLIRESQVLLVRHTYLEGWAMPGGGVDRYETLDAAARREAREEVGAELHDLSLVGAFSNFIEWKSDHSILFLSTDFTLAPAHDWEIAEMRFFPLDALPPDLWAPHRRRLEEYASRLAVPRFGQW